MARNYNEQGLGDLGPVGRRIANIEPGAMSSIPVRNGLTSNQNKQAAPDAERAPSPRGRQAGTDWED